MDMSMELTMLAWSVVLGLAQLVLAVVVANRDLGLPYNLSPRDQPPSPLGKTAGRLVRAYNNFRETFALFAASILLVVVMHRENEASALGAQLYFWARLVYVPVYAFGVQWVRTIVWTVAIVGLIMVLLAGLGLD
jgi:uncharacterized MAPEG superfamily protein